MNTIEKLVRTAVKLKNQVQAQGRQISQLQSATAQNYNAANLRAYADWVQAVAIELEIDSAAVAAHELKTLLTGDTVKLSAQTVDELTAEIQTLMPKVMAMSTQHEAADGIAKATAKFIKTLGE